MNAVRKVKALRCARCSLLYRAVLIAPSSLCVQVWESDHKQEEGEWATERTCRLGSLLYRNECPTEGSLRYQEVAAASLERQIVEKNLFVPAKENIR